MNKNIILNNQIKKKCLTARRRKPVVAPAIRYYSLSMLRTFNSHNLFCRIYSIRLQQTLVAIQCFSRRVIYSRQLWKLAKQNDTTMLYSRFEAIRLAIPIQSNFTKSIHMRFDIEGENLLWHHVNVHMNQNQMPTKARNACAHHAFHLRAISTEQQQHHIRPHSNSSEIQIYLYIFIMWFCRTVWWTNAAVATALFCSAQQNRIIAPHKIHVTQNKWMRIFLPQISQFEDVFLLLFSSSSSTGKIDKWMGIVVG